MNLERIRAMDDEELRRFLNRLSKSNVCNKCGNLASVYDKKTISVGIYNLSGQKVKKLCTLCDDCYSDLLDYLAVPDVDFEKSK